MKQEIIDKLPPDAQKEFLKLAMKLDEKTKQDIKAESILIYLYKILKKYLNNIFVVEKNYDG